MELSNKKSTSLYTPDCNNWAFVRQNDIHQVYAYNQGILPDFSPKVFNPEYWECNRKGECTESGRGSIGRFSINGHACILRHYRRGGLIKHFSKDTFFSPRVFSCRVEKELGLLQLLKAQNLPVPEPMAYRIQRRGLFCKMDIVLKEIPQSQNLIDILKREKIETSVWRQIGKVLRRFHEADVYHADLNAHNILLDNESKVWLVDFDKSALIKHSGWFWKARNLARLKRSLQKEERRRQGLHLNENDWWTLLSAYQE